MIRIRFRVLGLGVQVTRAFEFGLTDFQDPAWKKFAVSAFLGGGGSKPETLNPVTATGTEDQSENLGSESLTWRFMGSYKQGYKSLIWVISIVTPKP